MIMKCAYRNLWSTIKIENNVSVLLTLSDAVRKLT